MGMNPAPSLYSSNILNKVWGSKILRIRRMELNKLEGAG